MKAVVLGPGGQKAETLLQILRGGVGREVPKDYCCPTRRKQSVCNDTTQAVLTVVFFCLLDCQRDHIINPQPPCPEFYPFLSGHPKCKFCNKQLLSVQFYSMKCQKSATNANLNFPEPNETSSHCFFCPNNSPKHKNSVFIFINNTDK